MGTDVVLTVDVLKREVELGQVRLGRYNRWELFRLIQELDRAKEQLPLPSEWDESGRRCRGEERSDTRKAGEKGGKG